MKTYKVELTHEEILNLQSGCVEVWTNKANPKRVQEDATDLFYKLEEVLKPQR